MSQRRQDARRAQQDKRREERRNARVQQRKTTTVTPAAVTPAKTATRTTRTATPLKRGRRIRPLYVIAGVAAALLVILIILLVRDKTQALPGTHYPSNGNAHVTLGQSHGAYYTNPPTSGWHMDPIPNPGIYTTPMAPEQLGHFMEHGGVWALYTCPNGCDDVVSQLANIVNEQLSKKHPVALAPYPPAGYPLPEHRINIISWQYMLSLDDVDAGKINDFMDVHQCRYTPEGTGAGCRVGKRGDTEPEKDAGPSGFQYVAPPAPTAAPGASPTPAPSATAAATATPSPTVTAAGTATTSAAGPAGPTPPPTATP
jgi:hypothetical protein